MAVLDAYAEDIQDSDAEEERKFNELITQAAIRFAMDHGPLFGAGEGNEDAKRIVRRRLESALHKQGLCITYIEDE